MRLVLICVATLIVGAESNVASAQDPIRPTALVNFPDGSNFMLDRDLVYKIGINTPYSIVVPRGFVTDFASIPQAVHSFGLGPNGRYANASIVHDYLYWTQTCTRKQADNLMAIAMKEQRVDRLVEWSIHRAVKDWGEDAWKSNRTERRNGFVRTLAAPHDTVPALLAWKDYRKALKDRGVRNGSEPRVSPEVCRVGDHVVVPVGPR